MKLANRSSLLRICNHGVPRLHLSVFAGHPTDSTRPFPFSDTTTRHWAHTVRDLGADIPWPSSHGDHPLSPSELWLQSYMDSTETAFDTILHYPNFNTLATHTTHRLPGTTTISTDATYTVTSTGYNASLQPLRSHTPPRLHLPCRRSKKVIQFAPARFQP